MDKSQKKKAAVSAVAAVTAASVLVGGSFNSPGELLDDAPDAVVQSFELDSQTDAGDGADDGEEEEQRGKPASAIRRFVLALPMPVRALVALPLWIIGTGLIELGGTVWAAFLSPAFAAVANWAAIALMVLLVFMMAAKTIAPDLPIKKILNKKSVLGIFGLCLGFGLLDSLLPLFWDAYEQVSQIIRAVFSGVCTVVPIAFFMRRNKRRLREKEQARLEKELSYEEREKAARRLIEELADSVCR